MLMLTGPNVYATHLSDAQRYDDGYSNGSDAAATDLQNGRSFNATFDPNSVSTCSGGNATTYCNGRTRGNIATYNGGSPQTEKSGVSGSSQEDFASECNAIQSILVQSCSELINPDGTLTP
jgi:hypothetical protein